MTLSECEDRGRGGAGIWLNAVVVISGERTKVEVGQATPSLAIYETSTDRTMSPNHMIHGDQAR